MSALKMQAPACVSLLLSYVKLVVNHLGQHIKIGMCKDLSFICSRCIRL